jgi:hypothetical protein
MAEQLRPLLPCGCHALCLPPLCRSLANLKWRTRCCLSTLSHSLPSFPIVGAKVDRGDAIAVASSAGVQRPHHLAIAWTKYPRALPSSPLSPWPVSHANRAVVRANQPFLPPTPCQDLAGARSSPCPGQLRLSFSLFSCVMSPSIAIDDESRDGCPNASSG